MKTKVTIIEKEVDDGMVAFGDMDNGQGFIGTGYGQQVFMKVGCLSAMHLTHGIILRMGPHERREPVCLNIEAQRRSR